ncbi:MAG: hypothetical protein ACRCYY_03665 [Trueperaceae bacterium]
MNTVAQTYKHALELFNQDASSHAVEVAVAECVSAFAALRSQKIFIRLITRGEVLDSEQGFWKFLEIYGLTVKCWPRWNDDQAYLGLTYLKTPTPDDVEARVKVMAPWQVAA